MRHETRGALAFRRDAAQNIAEDTAGATFAMCLNDRRMRQLVERNVEIIGEAVSRLIRHDPWAAAKIREARLIVDFRNVVVHGYDAIDSKTVWRAVEESLPISQAEAETLLNDAEMDREDSSE
ncbi:MAG TPA: HepT-like ribonuclease domain-containing protein [Thermomicrobiales bacterium]|nr:HepT-like ribonuclease domain-containing protein [Thermomicrobiales bacterium]